MPYKKCIENRAWQDRLLNKIFTFAGIAGAASLTIGAYQLYQTYEKFLF